MDEHRPTAEELLKTPDLTHSQGFGRSFYSRRAQARLRKYFDDHPDTDSLEEIVAVLKAEEASGGR